MTLPACTVTQPVPGTRRVTGTRLLLVQFTWTPGLYPGPGLYTGPGYYPRFYGNSLSFTCVLYVRFAGTSTVNRSPHRHSSRCWLEAPAGSSTEKLAAASGRRRWPICWCCLDRGPGSFAVEDATTLSWSSAAVSEWVSRDVYAPYRLIRCRSRFRSVSVTYCHLESGTVLRRRPRPLSVIPGS